VNRKNRNSRNYSHSFNDEPKLFLQLSVLTIAQLLSDPPKNMPEIQGLLL